MEFEIDNFAVDNVFHQSVRGNIVRTEWKDRREACSKPRVGDCVGIFTNIIGYNFIAGVGRVVSFDRRYREDYYTVVLAEISTTLKKYNEDLSDDSDSSDISESVFSTYHIGAIIEVVGRKVVDIEHWSIDGVKSYHCDWFDGVFTDEFEQIYKSAKSKVKIEKICNKILSKDQVDGKYYSIR